MSNPGIKPAGKKGLPIVKIFAALGVVGVVGAVAFGVKQCGDEEAPQQPQPVPTQPQPQAPSRAPAQTYYYTLTQDAPMHAPTETDASEFFVKRNSCVTSVPDKKGDPSRTAQSIEIQAVNDDKMTQHGFVLKRFLNNSGPPRGACLAEFVSATTSNQQPVKTNGPVGLYAVNLRANLYNSANAAQSPAAVTGQGSCVQSTGNVRGDFMEVRARMNLNDVKTFWAQKNDFSPESSFAKPENCFAKLKIF